MSPYAVGSRAADADIAFGQLPQTLLDANIFALDVKQYLAQHNLGSNPIYLTGHSLGGAEAENVAFIVNPGGTMSGVTFGAPGVPSLQAPVQAPNFINYVDYGDPVGNFGNHFGTVLLVGASSNNGVPTLPIYPADHLLSHYAVDLGLQLAPTMSSISATTDNHATDVNAGHLVTITVSTSEAVTVKGIPTLQLNDNEVATYTSGSGTYALTFAYTVLPGDNVADLQVTGLNLPSGATIQDSGGNNLSGGVTGNLGIQIDTTPPVVTITSAGGPTNHAVQTISGTVDVADVGTLVTVYDGTTALSTATVQSNGSWSDSTALTGNGVHTLMAQDTDAAGNIGISNAVTYTLNTPFTCADLYITSAGTQLTVSATSGVLANDTDPNGLSLSATLDQTTAHGTLVLDQNGSFTYTPQTGFVGTDSFTYTANDGTFSSAVTTAGIVVGSLNALTSPAQMLTELYVGYFDRAPDVGGLNYWLTNYNTPSTSSSPNPFYQNLGHAADSFADPGQTETVALYPFLANPSAATSAQLTNFVVSAYENLFNRMPDPTGEAYWINAINTHSVTAPQALLAFILGAQANDAQTIANKVTAGLYYYDLLAANNVAATVASDHAALSGVTFDPATVLASEATTNAFVLSAEQSSATSVSLVGQAGTSVLDHAVGSA